MKTIKKLEELMEEFTGIQQFEQLYTADAVSVLVFSADWCSDCRYIEPFMPKIIEKYNNYKFYYVNRDKNIELSQQLSIMGIPSFVVIGKGAELGRFVSRSRKTEKEIDRFLSEIK